MRVIAVKTLKTFWQKPAYRDSEQPLRAWYIEARKATWKMPQDIRKQYRTASTIANHRIVFNIGGNKYRLVVAIKYEFGIIYIRFIGTHKQYDKINVEEV